MERNLEYRIISTSFPTVLCKLLTHITWLCKIHSWQSIFSSVFQAPSSGFLPNNPSAFLGCSVCAKHQCCSLNCSFQTSGNGRGNHMKLTSVEPNHGSVSHRTPYSDWQQLRSPTVLFCFT